MVLSILGPRMSARARDVLAIATVCIFLFPIAFWAVISFKPSMEVFEPNRSLFFDFWPTLSNYRQTLWDSGPDMLSTGHALANSIAIGIISTILSLVLAIPAAFGLSRLYWRYTGTVLFGTLLFRFLPPIALIIPVAVIFREFGLFNMRVGVALMHAVLNLPIAILVLKSFLDDIPREVDDAARIDGASNLQILFKIHLPMLRNAIAATAVLCLIFSWTEFLMSLFLSVSFRTVPIKMSILPMGEWGPLAASGILALVPFFVFILTIQRHLVRGLTLGVEK